MPVAVAVPGRQPEKDPLDKLSQALNIASTVYGIASDSRALNQAKEDRDRKKQLDDLSLKEAQRKEAEALEGSQTSGPLMDTIRQAAKARGLTIPEGTTVKQARTNFDAFLKPKDSSMPSDLTEPDRKIITDTASKLSDIEAIKDSIDEVIATLNDPKETQEQKIVAARGSLKLLNSAHTASPDAVGKEEAERAGALVTPSIFNKLPGGVGPAFTPDVEGYRKQLEILSQNLGNKSVKMRSRVEGAMGSKLKSLGPQKIQNKMAAKPKTIKQNGFTYTLNEQTGEYE